MSCKYHSVSDSPWEEYRQPMAAIVCSIESHYFQRHQGWVKGFLPLTDWISWFLIAAAKRTDPIWRVKIGACFSLNWIFHFVKRCPAHSLPTSLSITNANACMKYCYLESFKGVRRFRTKRKHELIVTVSQTPLIRSRWVFDMTILSCCSKHDTHKLDRNFLKCCQEHNAHYIWLKSEW